MAHFARTRTSASATLRPLASIKSSRSSDVRVSSSTSGWGLTAFGGALLAGSSPRQNRKPAPLHRTGSCAIPWRPPRAGVTPQAGMSLRLFLLDPRIISSFPFSCKPRRPCLAVRNMARCNPVSALPLRLDRRLGADTARSGDLAGANILRGNRPGQVQCTSTGRERPSRTRRSSPLHRLYRWAKVHCTSGVANAMALPPPPVRRRAAGDRARGVRRYPCQRIKKRITE